MRLKPLQKATIRAILRLLMPKEESRTMTKHQPIDPAVVLQEAFPNNLFETMARECGFIERHRDFCPVTFFWALTTSVLFHSCTGIAAFKREYDRLAKEEIDRPSFHKHFNEEFVEFMRRLFSHACETVFPKKAMPECLRVFTETLLQDNTILKLRRTVADRWPGAGLPAAVKLNVSICINGGGSNKVQIAKGTKSEVKFTTINSSVKEALLIFEYAFMRSFRWYFMWLKSNTEARYRQSTHGLEIQPLRHCWVSAILPVLSPSTLIIMRSSNDAKTIPTKRLIPL